MCRLFEKIFKVQRFDVVAKIVEPTFWKKLDDAVEGHIVFISFQIIVQLH